QWLWLRNDCGFDSFMLKSTAWFIPIKRYNQKLQSEEPSSQPHSHALLSYLMVKAMTAAASPGEVAPGLLSLGPWLKQRRRFLDMTQDDLAQKSVCSLATIRKIEAGDLL